MMRMQEIGIRMALGAQPRDVRNMVLLYGIRLALAGVAIGVEAALALGRYHYWRGWLPTPTGI
jgi:putative ABC transport system permease protein